MKTVISRILREPKLVGAGALLLIVLGLLSLRGIQVDLFPPLNFPVLNLIVENSAFSSMEMERQVTLPIESAVGGIVGVTRVRSTSSNGISMVSVEFSWGTDMLAARQWVTEALSRARDQLPPDTQPSLENLSATLSMIEGYSFQGGDDPVKLRDMALYDLVPRLQSLAGVYKVIVMGGKVLEYAIEPRPSLMMKYDLTLDDLKTALADNNIVATLGVVNQGEQELVVHADGQFTAPSDIGEVVAAVKNGIPVRIKDAARVSQTFQGERGDTSEKGSPCVLINVLKRPAADTGSVADEVKGEIDRFQKTLPSGFSFHNYYDQAGLVRDSIGSVKESVWMGAVLVVLVLAAFLGDWKTTVIAALSIPLSILAAMLMMRASRQGLNIMSLGGLAIGTGIIVDDAIVVLENIFRWLSTPGLRRDRPGPEVVLEAAAEVSRPVLVSTLTNIGIFFPMLFVAGFAGRLFAPVSWILIDALLASLVAAFTVIPVLSIRWLAEGKQREEKNSGISRGYARLLDRVLRRPLAAALLSLSPALLAIPVFRHLNSEFLPALDEGAMLINTDMPPGTGLVEVRRLNLKVEEWLKGLPGVETVVRRTGHAPGAEDTDNVNHSDITLKLAPKNKRPYTLEALEDALRERLSSLPGLRVAFVMPLADKINDAVGGVPADIGVDLYGPEIKGLHERMDRILAALGKVPGLVDVTPPSDIPVPSLEANVKRAEMGRLGVSEKAVYDVLQAYSLGLPATRVRGARKAIDVTLRYAPAGQDLDHEALRSLPLRTTGGNTVPLEQVAALSFGEVPSDIQHEHLHRKLTVTANIQGRRAGDVAWDIEKVMAGQRLPQGYFWDFTGKYKMQRGAQSNMAVVFAAAVLVVAVILWLEFRSLTQVGLILLTLPLAEVGAVLALWLCRESLNISSMLGAVMLVGIVVRNGIMLVDYMNMHARQGLSPKEAVRAAAMERARPILMTASVTILGLLPLAAGWGTGSELLRPLAVAVIGGLAVSTSLTLILIPAATLLLSELRRRK